MEFVFDEHKSAEAASLLLEQHDNAMPYIKLIKLLYLADRESLVETGFPITGDRFVSMKYGPVLSHVLDLIKDQSPSEDSIWHRYIARKYYSVELIARADPEHLSEYEESVLNGIFKSHGSMKEWDLVARTHALPEWTDPGRSSVSIDPEQILYYAGYSDSEVHAAVEQASAVYSLRMSTAAGR